MCPQPRKASAPLWRHAALAAIAIALLLSAPVSAQEGAVQAAAPVAAPGDAAAPTPAPAEEPARVWPAGSIPRWNGTGPIKVCTSEFTPSECWWPLPGAAAAVARTSHLVRPRHPPAGSRLRAARPPHPQWCTARTATRTPLRALRLSCSARWPAS